MTVEINDVEFTSGDWTILIKADGRLDPDGPTTLIDAYMSEPYDPTALVDALRAIAQRGTADEKAIATLVLAALQRPT